MAHLTCKELNDVGCSNPGCTGDHSIIYLHPACHDAGMFAYFDKEVGMLVLECAECEQPIASILVARSATIN